MSDDDQYALCWNNFNKNLTAGFHNLYSRGEFTDVTLTAGGQMLKAHRMVLSVCSPYFQAMFESTPTAQHPIIFLKDISFKNLTDLVQFMYCGEVHVKQDDLAGFIAIAESLQIKGLTESGGDTHSPENSKAEISTSLRPLRAAKRNKKKQELEEVSCIPMKVNKRQITSTPRQVKKLSTNNIQDPLQQDMTSLPSTSSTEFIEIGAGIHTKTEPSYDEPEMDSHYLQPDETFNASDLVEKDETYENTYSEIEDPQQQPETQEDLNADTATELTFIKSPWATPCLIINNFIYNCHSNRGNKGYWRCHNYSRKIPDERCRARVVIRDGQIKAMTGGPHNHPPHTEKIQRTIKRNSMVEILPKIEYLEEDTPDVDFNIGMKLEDCIDGVIVDEEGNVKVYQDMV